MLTDRKARNIKAGAVVPADVAGLTLRRPRESRSTIWVLRYVSPVTHKRREMGLGSFPAVGVAAARRAAQKAREAIADERDPLAERQAAHEIPTFEAAARERYAAVAPSFRNARHRQNWIRRLELYAFPKIGGRKVDTLEARDFARMLKPIWLTRPETARRVKQRCQQVLDACLAQGLIKDNCVRVVDLLLPAQPEQDCHQPAMPWKLVPEFVRDVLMHEPVLGARACLLWCVLTGARSNEARGCRWEEIDLDAKLWTVPAERMKAHHEHRVPLSEAALELLAHQPHDQELVFPSINGKYLSDMALTSILRKAHAASDVQGKPATCHGFRSSFRDWCADHGYQTELAERALAHRIANQVQAAYERSDRLEARRDLMQRWGAFVMAGEGSNVVPLRARTA